MSKILIKVRDSLFKVPNSLSKFQKAACDGFGFALGPGQKKCIWGKTSFWAQLLADERRCFDDTHQTRGRVFLYMIYARSPDVAFDEFNLYTFCTSTHASFSLPANSYEHACFSFVLPAASYLFNSSDVLGFCWVVCPFHPPGYHLTEFVRAGRYNSPSRIVFADD